MRRIKIDVLDYMPAQLGKQASFNYSDYRTREPFLHNSIAREWYILYGGRVVREHLSGLWVKKRFTSGGLTSLRTCL